MPTSRLVLQRRRMLDLPDTHVPTTSGSKSCVSASKIWDCGNTATGCRWRTHAEQEEIVAAVSATMARTTCNGSHSLFLPIWRCISTRALPRFRPLHKERGTDKLQSPG